MPGGATAPGRPARRSVLKSGGCTALMLGAAALPLFSAPIAQWAFRGFSLDPNGFCGEGTLRRELEALMSETPGAVGYRQVSASDEFLSVSILAGEVIRRLSKSAMSGSTWEETLSPDELQRWDPRIALTPAELPLAAVERAWGLRKDDSSSGPTLTIDDAMHVQLSMPDTDGSSDAMGLTLDRVERVPRRSPDAFEDVRAAVDEIVAEYAPQVQMIGSFNGFVHVDGAVAQPEGGATGVFRLVRRPTEAPHAMVIDPDPLDPALAFDPAVFDPLPILQAKADVVSRAGLDGKVWDWEFRRPKPGAEPAASFGIGPSGPTSRVWLAKDSSIAAVEDASGACLGDTGWCTG